MSEEKINIEFEKEILESIFKEAGVDFPENPCADDIKKALSSIKKNTVSDNKKEDATVNQDNKEAVSAETHGHDDAALDPDNKGAASAKEQIPMDEIKFNGKNILVVDDLGVVNYQLSCILKREGYKVHTTTSVSNGVDYFKTKRVDIAILDLYLPSEREGFLLLEEIVKIKQSVNKECRIVIMSSDLKPDYKKLCKSIGAHKFIEKTTGWHEQIADLCS